MSFFVKVRGVVTKIHGNSANSNTQLTIKITNNFQLYLMLNDPKNVSLSSLMRWWSQKHTNHRNFAGNFEIKHGFSLKIKFQNKKKKTTLLQI